MLVPAITSIGILISSSTLRTPTCAAPRAPPPPRASPILGRCVGGASAGCPRLARADSARSARRAVLRPIIGTSEFLGVSFELLDLSLDRLTLVGRGLVEILAKHLCGL